MIGVSLFLADEAATRSFGEDLALTIRAGDCLALEGDLGAGKSALSRALIRALADDDALDVPSPTFTLVQSYELRIPIHHFDLYRLGDESELAELGLDEALDRGAALIEWPDRAGSQLPKSAIRIRIRQERDGRRLEVDAPEGRFLSRLKRVLAIRDFLDARKGQHVERRFLTGDSSFRAYERVTTPVGEQLVLMDSPERSNGPPIRDGKPYSQLVHLAENVKPFIAVDHYLRSLGLSAPDIYESDIDQGIMLIEDLGSEGVLDSHGRPIAERYQEAVRLLADYHRNPTPEMLPIGNGLDHVLSHFSRETLKFETELLLDWHLAWRRDGEGVSDAEKREYLAIWDHLIDELDSVEKRLVMRDFHSPNLLWLPEREGFKRIGVIDFQDAIIGPSAYDLVSISQDARVTVKRPLMEQLIATYLEARHATGDFDQDSFLKAFAIMSAQRACRLNGLWVRLLKRDGMPHYMQHMPRTLWHLSMALEHPVNAPLRDWCKQAGIPQAESPEV
jgi:tRNA threonylcarbamoyl adenosine modification protein YjeE